MFTHPRKIAYTGLFIGAVAIAACLSQMDHSWFSPDELGLERDNAGAHPTSSDTIAAPVPSVPVAVPDDSTSIAGQRYAVRTVLQNDEVSTAQSRVEAA